MILALIVASTTPFPKVLAMVRHVNSMLEPTDLLQQMSKYSTKQPLKGRHANPGEGLPNEGLYEEAQPRGPTPYPY